MLYTVLFLFYWINHKMYVTTYTISNVRVSIGFKKKLNTFIIAFLRCNVQSSLIILCICKIYITNVGYYEWHNNTWKNVSNLIRSHEQKLLQHEVKSTLNLLLTIHYAKHWCGQYSIAITWSDNYCLTNIH